MKNIKYEINKISSIRLSEGITFNVLKKVIKTAILVVVICGSLLSYGIIASKAATTSTLVPPGAIAGYLYKIAGYSLRQQALASDSTGNIYTCNSSYSNILMIPAVSGTYFGQSMTAGNSYIIAGTGTEGTTGTGGPALSAEISCSGGIAISDNGSVYINEGSDVSMIPQTTGTYYGQAMTADYIYSVAGTGTNGYSGDGGPAVNAGISPSAIAVSGSGNIAFVEWTNTTYAIRFIPVAPGTYYGQAMTADYIYTVAGDSTTDCTAGYIPSGAATSADLCYPAGIAIGPSGNIVFGDYRLNLILILPATSGTYFGQAMTAGDIYRIAGTGSLSGNNDVSGVSPTSVPVWVSSGFAVDSRGDIAFLQESREVDFIPAVSGTYFGYPMTEDKLYIIGGLATGGGLCVTTTGVEANQTSIGEVALAFDSAGNVYETDCYGIYVIPNTGASGLPYSPSGLTFGTSASVVNLSWNVPQDNGAGITDYKITTMPKGGSPSVIDTPTSLNPLSDSVPLNSLNLVPGDTYTFSVTAVNANGSSPPSLTTAPITYATGVPSAPLSPTVTSENASLMLSWQAPSSQGASAVSDYLVTYWPNNGPATTVDTASTSTSYNLTGLNAGTTYSVVITAVNGQGDGPPSTFVSATTFGPPSVPNTPNIVYSSTGVSLSWSAPNDNQSPITDYTVSEILNGGTPITINTNSTNTAYIPSNLVPGDTYSFAVSATNAIGTSNYSSYSSPIVYGAPSQPLNVGAMAGNSMAQVMWSLPTYNLNNISDYLITVIPKGLTPYTIDTKSTNQSDAIYGLTNLTSYTFTVTAVNSYGNSQPSVASNTSIPATVPGAPAQVQDINVFVNDPALNTGASGDVISIVPPIQDPLGVTSYLIDGCISLPPGQTYAEVGFQPIAGCNTNIETATSYAGTTQGGTLTGFTWIGGITNSNQPSLSFTTPTDCTIGIQTNTPGTVNGVLSCNANNLITGDLKSVDSNYIPPEIVDSLVTVTPSTGSPFVVDTGNLSSPNFTISGLNPSLAYTFTGTCYDGYGWSQFSVTDPNPVSGVPSTPTAPVATPGNGTVSLTWSAPESNGSPITDYIITSSAGQVIDTKSTNTTYTVTGLTNGTSYSYSVTAVNSYGNSFASPLSNSVIPAPVPSAPTAPVATPGNGTVSLTWSAPNDGGSPITDYIITSSAGQVIDTKSTNTTYTVTGLTNGTSYSYSVTAVNATGSSNASALSNAVMPIAPLNEYFPVVPTRIVDTRANSGYLDQGGTLTPGATLSLDVAGNYNIPNNATAVVLNVTATDTTSWGYLTVYPDSTTIPTSSSLNWIAANQTKANLVTVPIGKDGKVDFYNKFGNTDLVVDLQGYFMPDSLASGQYSPVTPMRICDTRVSTTQCPNKTLGPGQSITINATGTDSIPSNASSVVINLTATNTTAWGYLSVSPNGKAVTSSVNFTGANQSVSNSVIAELSSTGTFTITNALGNTDVIVDITGYYTGSTSTITQTSYTPMTPTRILDTRANSGYLDQGMTLAPGTSLNIPITGLNNIPTSAKAIVINVTATNTTNWGYLTISPNSTAATSNLNWVSPEDSVANLDIATLSSAGSIVITNGSTGSVDVVIDLMGYYD